MKLVFKTDDLDEAHKISDLLSSRGIPSKVEENSLRNRGSHIPSGNDVWIYINSQYGDATKLIAGADHNVSDPVDPEEFERFLKQRRLAALNTVYSTALKWGMAAVVFGIVVVLLVI